MSESENENAEETGETETQVETPGGTQVDETTPAEGGSDGEAAE